MRKILLSCSLIIMLFQNSMPSAIALGGERVPSDTRARELENTLAASSLKVHLSTAPKKTIVFKAQGMEGAKAESSDHEIPHLVLNRNGVATPGFERTLLVSVDNLVVPAPGLYVELVIETQHGDPDLDRKNNVRIRVWREVKFIPADGTSQQEFSAQFKVTFNPITELPQKTIKTPTDYYRYRIIISDAQGNQLEAHSEDYALLMENQWRVPLPEVLEATPGAAPDELLVYYYDMMPFQTDLRDPDSKIPRQEVGPYIQTELIPALTEAFRVQSNVWGFPWYEEWRNFRREEDPKTLSVALGEHHVWFHGEPASLGHSMISIRVDGTTGEYDSLTDGLMSTFHHELFHNHQRNIALHYSYQAALAGKEDAWMMFTEGTAVLASSVGQPEVQLEQTPKLRSFLKRANAFLGEEGATGGGLNKSYKDIPYHTAIYWRFLYEHCGGMNLEGEDPTTGMQVIRHILETFYKGEVVQINSSTDTASAFPRIIDVALQSTPSCKFHTYEESLVHFARAIYMLRLGDGRCPSLVELSSCGFMDPYQLYQTPPADHYVIAADTVAEISGSIPSSYGIDLIDLEFDPSIKGKRLEVILSSAVDSSEYHVEIWKTKMTDEKNRRQSAQIGDPVSMYTQDGSLAIQIDTPGSDDFDSLGLIITRMDPHEETESTGAYSIQLSAK